jgi:hypothetical protein
MGPEFDVFVSDEFESLASNFSSKQAEKALRNLLPTLSVDNLFVSDGTLLGILRDDALISHDSDVDFGIVIKKNEIPPTNILNFEVIRKVSWCGLPMQIAYNYHETIIDFLFYYEGFTPSFLIHCQPETLLKIPVDYILPLKKSMFKDSEIKVPNQPTEFFVWSYGLDWQFPQQSKGNWFAEYPNLFSLSEVNDFELDLQSMKILELARASELNMDEGFILTQHKEMKLRQELDMANLRLTGLLNSTSWRITRPIRVVSRFFKNYLFPRIIKNIEHISKRK